jgi:uncharacterized membrane protein (GlpM family)
VTRAAADPTLAPTSRRDSPSDRAIAVAAAVDAAIVMLFVAIGRRNHDREETVSGLLETAAPFMLALVAGWLIVRAWRRPLAPVTGLGLWGVTLALGMTVRRFVFDDGTAASFVVVAGVFLLLLPTWRAAVAVVRRNR